MGKQTISFVIDKGHSVLTRLHHWVEKDSFEEKKRAYIESYRRYPENLQEIDSLMKVSLETWNQK